MKIMKKKLTFGRVLIVAALVAYTVFLLFPLITVLITSFIPSEELASSTTFLWWSENMSLEAYKTIFLYDSYIDIVGVPGLLLGLFNTLWLTLIPLVAGLVVSGFSAYAFSKMDFPFKETLFKFSVIIRSIPLGAFGVISYVFYSAIGWTGENGFLPLLIPGMFGGLGTVFFLRLFFDGIPNSLIEAATLDGAGFFQCGSHAADTCQIFCAGTLAPLLRTAVDHIGQGEASAAIQRAHALRTMEFMGRQAEHIDVHVFDINMHMTGSLDSIRVEGNTCFLADGANLSDGQDRADFVVGKHHGDQAGILPDRILDLLGGNIVVFGNIQIGDIIAFFFQLLEGVQHGVMLEGGGNDVLFALALSQTGSGKDSLIVGFTAAGGKVNLPGLTAQTGGNGGTGRLQCFLGFLTYGMEAGGIAVNGFKTGQHGPDRSFTHFGSGCVISINLHRTRPFVELPSRFVGNIPLFAYFVNG